MTIAIASQSEICERFGALAVPPQPGEKLGIALATLELTPLNALRQRSENGTCGWYVWGGEEMGTLPDFFAPLHIDHLPSYAPKLMPYLALPPGWRVLLAPGYEDVWFDQELLDAKG